MRPVASPDRCDAWADDLASIYQAPVSPAARLASFNFAKLMHMHTVSCGGPTQPWSFSVQMVGNNKTILTACIDGSCFDSIRFLEQYVKEGEFQIDFAPELFFDPKSIRHKIFVGLQYKSNNVALHLQKIASKGVDKWTECTIDEKHSNIEHEMFALPKGHYAHHDPIPLDLKQCSGWHRSGHPCSNRAARLAIGFMDAFTDSDSRLHHDTYNYEDSAGDQMRILHTSVDDVAGNLQTVYVWPEFLSKGSGTFEANTKSNLRHAVMQWLMRSKLPWCPRDFKLHFQSQHSGKCDFIHVAITGDHEVRVMGATYNDHSWFWTGHMGCMGT